MSRKPTSIPSAIERLSACHTLPFDLIDPASWTSMYKRLWPCSQHDIAGLKAHFLKPFARRDDTLYLLWKVSRDPEQWPVVSLRDDRSKPLVIAHNASLFVRQLNLDGLTVETVDPSPRVRALGTESFAAFIS